LLGALEHQDLRWGVGPLKGVGIGVVVGSAVDTAAGEEVGACFATNQVHVVGLNSVLLRLLGDACCFESLPC